MKMSIGEEGGRRVSRVGDAGGRYAGRFFQEVGGAGAVEKGIDKVEQREWRGGGEEEEQVCGVGR